MREELEALEVATRRLPCSSRSRLSCGSGQGEVDDARDQHCKRALKQIIHLFVDNVELPAAGYTAYGVR